MTAAAGTALLHRFQPPRERHCHYVPQMDNRWKGLAGSLFGGQLVAVALVLADVHAALALVIASIPTAILYGVQRLTADER